MSDRNKALFPISLSNQAFSTENVLPLLLPLFAQYSQVVFLVADRLQIYNKALRVDDEITLADVIRDFDAKQRHLEERRRWIDRLAQRMDVHTTENQWSIIGLEELADADCYRIFRNVMLAYYALNAFRDDVDASAAQHAETREDRFPTAKSERLSRGYLLEEIALSIRVHVVEGIRDEYYLGAQAVPVLRLYKGHYGLWPEELAEIDRAAGDDRFFTVDPQDGKWVQNP